MSMKKKTLRSFKENVKKLKKTYSGTSFIQLFECIFSDLVELSLGLFAELRQIRRPLIKKIGEANLLRLKHGDLCQKLLALRISFRRRTLGIGLLRPANAPHGTSHVVRWRVVERVQGSVNNGLESNHVFMPL